MEPAASSRWPRTSQAGERRDRRARPRRLQRRHAPLASTAEQLRTLAAVPLLNAMAATHDSRSSPAGRLRPAQLDIFQVNLGKLCNMACRHCHVDAGPDRTDAMMSDEVVDRSSPRSARSRRRGTVDLTGGAPELHPRFRDVVEAAVAAGKHVMDRCNLTVLLVPRNAGLIEWLRGAQAWRSSPRFRITAGRTPTRSAARACSRSR